MFIDLEPQEASDMNRTLDIEPNNLSSTPIPVQRDTLVVLGDDAQLNCTGDKSQGYTVVWILQRVGQQYDPTKNTLFTGSEPINSSLWPRYYVAYNSTTKERDLQISSATFEDAGIYYCHPVGLTGSDIGPADLVVIG